MYFLEIWQKSKLCLKRLKNASIKFSTLIDKSFANKRKGIKNNLKKFDIDFQQLAINPLSRAQELSIEEFISIFRVIDI